MRIKVATFQPLLKMSIILLFTSKFVLADNLSDEIRLTGIWAGTIGSSKITACFKNERSGFYYYNRYAYPIAIEGLKNNITTFHETNGDWVIDSNSHNKLSGSWIRTKDKKIIKIDLRKIKSQNNGVQDCSDLLFVDRILKNITKTTKKIKITDHINAQYITASLPSNENFSVRVLELTGDSPVANNINSILNPEQNLSFNIESMRECVAFSLLNGDASAVYNDSHTIAGNYLKVHSNSDFNYCNTNYRIAHGESIHTLNLKTGKSENLISWFKDSKVYDGTPVKLSEELLKFIFDRLDGLPPTEGLTAKEREECYADPGSDIMISILRSGFKFELPPTSNYSCGESIDISFTDLKPFLNNYGIQSIKELESTNR